MPLLEHLNWLGIVAGAAAIWGVHLLYTRRTIPSTVRSRSSRWRGELTVIALSLMIAFAISLAQSVHDQGFGGAVAIGVLLAVVPVAYFLGADSASHPARRSSRALMVAIEILTCSIVVYLVHL
jgi:hypothetical protein